MPDGAVGAPGPGSGHSGSGGQADVPAAAPAVVPGTAVPAVAVSGHGPGKHSSAVPLDPVVAPYMHGGGSHGLVAPVGPDGPPDVTT